MPAPATWTRRCHWRRLSRLPPGRRGGTSRERQPWSSPLPRWCADPNPCVMRTTSAWAWGRVTEANHPGGAPMTTVETEGQAKPLTPEELDAIDAWWRAANYLSVGQIYLLDNPLLRQPLTLEHIKPRLLGHWGTTPGLTLLYA